MTRVSPPIAAFFSKRCLAACGVPVLAHQCVADAALLEAAARIDAALTHLPLVAARLRSLGCALQVIGKEQECTDLPQYEHLRADADAAAAFNRRGRGYGGLAPSCGEENLLALPCDRYADHRDICSHELAHAILDWGFPAQQSDELKSACEATRASSVAAGRWRGAYASTNADEFFAECCMWALGSRGDVGLITSPPVEPGPGWLLQHDPDAAALVQNILTGKFFGDAGDDGCDDVVDLVPSSPKCDNMPWRSPMSDTPPCCLVIVNTTARPVTLTWLDAAGAPHGYGTAPAGCSTGQRTFVGHVWQLTCSRSNMSSPAVPHGHRKRGAPSGGCLPSPSPRSKTDAAHPADGAAAAASASIGHVLGVVVACSGTGRVVVRSCDGVGRSKRKATQSCVVGLCVCCGD